MKYSYNLFSPLDYLKLLYCAFFRWHDRPKPDNRRNQSVLIIQGVVLILIACFTGGWLSNWGGDIRTYLFLTASCVAFGVAFGVAYGVALGIANGVAVIAADGVAFGVACGVAFGVAGGVAFGVAGGVAFGVAVGVSGGVAFGFAFGMTRSVAGGLAVGAAVGVAVGVAVKIYFLMGGVWGWVAGLGAALVGGFVFFLGWGNNRSFDLFNHRKNCRKSLMGN